MRGFPAQLALRPLGMKKMEIRSLGGDKLKMTKKLCSMII
jgi:hypothetical protein